MILDYLNHELVRILVVQNFPRKHFRVKKLDLGTLAPILRGVIILKFVIHVIFYEFTELLLRLIPILDERLILFHVAIVIFDTQLFFVAFTRFESFQPFWINNIGVNRSIWHDIHIEILTSFGLVAAVENIKNTVIVSQNCLIFGNVFSHEHFGPANEQNWFLSILTILVFLSK